MLIALDEINSNIKPRNQKPYIGMYHLYETKPQIIDIIKTNTPIESKKLKLDFRFLKECPPQLTNNAMPARYVNSLSVNV